MILTALFFTNIAKEKPILSDGLLLLMVMIR